MFFSMGDFYYIVKVHTTSLKIAGEFVEIEINVVHTSQVFAGVGIASGYVWVAEVSLVANAECFQAKESKLTCVYYTLDVLIAKFPVEFLVRYRGDVAK